MTLDTQTRAAYDAAAASAAWLQVPHDVFVMNGRDAATVLHKLCSNDISKLSPGDCCEAFICNVQGKVVGHIWATRTEDGMRIATPTGQAAKLIAHLDRYVITEDVTFSDVSDQWKSVMIVGPSASAALAEQLPCSIDAEASKSRWSSLDGVDGTMVRRADWGTGLLVTGTTSAIQERVSPPLDEALPNASSVWNLLRIEAGFPIYGIDISEDNLPQEVQRNEQAISFNKGCYLGQETVARIDALGHVNWLLTPFRLSAVIADLPAPLTANVDGKPAARLTSWCDSPRFGGLTMGYVRRGFQTGETDIELQNEAGAEPIVITPAQMPPPQQDDA